MLYFQVEQLYLEVLFETLHSLGYDAQENQEEILQHLKKAFQFNDEKHESLLEAAREKDVSPMLSLCER
jgi:Holliday junction resolvasome RuvABC DNA-binding subunit